MTNSLILIVIGLYIPLSSFAQIPVTGVYNGFANVRIVRDEQKKNCYRHVYHMHRSRANMLLF
jgi:hypothetical protein